MTPDLGARIRFGQTRIALTGATGLVGRFLLAGLAETALTTLGRQAVAGHPHQPWELGRDVDLRGTDVLVHAAFSHVPGRYRGGEGDDPQGFLAANLDGTRRLFDAAQRDGVRQVIFLSSRAVFDGLPTGTPLTEDRQPEAQSLYGQVKHQAEAHLAGLGLQGISLRATGIYGPGPRHKWCDLFLDYVEGRPIAPRRGTEVHGADLARAVSTLIGSDLRGAVHVSDVLLDRHDLLSDVRHLTECPHALPAPSDRPINALHCARLKRLGWRPGGRTLLRRDLPQMLRQALSH